jgi:hypothetical protein
MAKAILTRIFLVKYHNRFRALGKSAIGNDYLSVSVRIGTHSKFHFALSTVSVNHTAFINSCWLVNEYLAKHPDYSYFLNNCGDFVQEMVHITKPEFGTIDVPLAPAMIKRMDGFDHTLDARRKKGGAKHHWWESSHSGEDKKSTPKAASIPEAASIPKAASSTKAASIPKAASSTKTASSATAVTPTSEASSTKKLSPTASASSTQHASPTPTPDLRACIPQKFASGKKLDSKKPEMIRRLSVDISFEFDLRYACTVVRSGLSHT